VRNHACYSAGLFLLGARTGAAPHCSARFNIIEGVQDSDTFDLNQLYAPGCPLLIETADLVAGEALGDRSDRLRH
jgi:hypothetical protein